MLLHCIFFAPLCVLREQHLRTVGEIQAETLLDREHAALALQRLRRYRRADRLDTDVLAQFGLTRNPRENILEKRLKVIVPLLASLLIFMGGLFHLHLFTYKKPYSDTETNTCAMGHSRCTEARESSHGALPKRLLPSAVLPALPSGRLSADRRGSALYGFSAL